MLPTSAMSQAPIRFCGDYFPPFVVKSDKPGQPSGIAVSYINAIFSELEKDVTIDIVAWARCKRMLQKGQADATFLIRKTESRASFLSFSEPILSRPIFLYHHKDKFDSPFQWQTIEDLKPYTFISGRGFAITQDLKRLGIEVITETTSQIQIYEMMSRARADFFTDFSDSFESVVEQNPKFKDRLIQVKKPFKYLNYRIGWSKQSQQVGLLEQLDLTIKKLKNKGVITKLTSSN